MAITLDGNNTGTVGVINSATAQASTSGTRIDFTGIPSGVKRITVMFNGVSTSGGNDYFVQLGTGSSPAYTTSGYTSTRSNLTSAAVSTANATTAFSVAVPSAGAQTISGHVVMTNVSGNIWICSSVLGNYGDTRTYVQGGSVTLGAALTAVRITTSGGTDTFDAGSINILYE